MTIKLQDRNPEYWEKLFQMTANVVKQMSDEFERGVKWEYSVPLIDFKRETSGINRSPFITRHGKGCILCMPVGFLKWKDDFVIDMQEYLGSNNGFCVNNGQNDISLWVLQNWISWITQHELGHLFNGHYVGDTREWDDWNKFDHFDSLNNDIRLSFEYDADMYAADSFFSGLAYAINIDNRLKNWGEKYFNDLGFIFFVLFTIMEERDPNPSLHPAANDRLMMFLLRGFKIFETSNNTKPVKEFKAFQLGMAQAVMAIADQGNDLLEKLKNFNHDRIVQSIKVLIENKYHLRRMYQMKIDWLTNTKDLFYKN